jgi:hypothetical protein
MLDVPQFVVHNLVHQIRRHRMAQEADRELKALTAVHAALNGLAQDAVGRILDYARARYGIRDLTLEAVTKLVTMKGDGHHES